MTAIAPKQHPLVLSDMGDCAKISRHVPRGFNNPETAIAKKVHCPFKRSKLHPRPPENLPSLGSLHWVEEVSIPLHCLFCLI